MNNLVHNSLATFTKKVREQEQLHESPAFSYFGYWLVFATFCDEVMKKPAYRELVEEFLGGDLAELAATAKQLRDDLPVEIATHSAIYGDDYAPIPTQDDFNAMIDRLTNGLITEFALPDPEMIETLMVTVVALETEWARKFTKRGPWLLGNGDSAAILGTVNTESVGEVVIYAPHTTNDVRVLSVLAERHYTPEQVWAATDEVLGFIQQGSLELNAATETGFAWSTNTESRVGNGKPVQDVFVPAFDYEATTMLGRTAAVIGEGKPVQGTQKAVAQYNETGYKAAAVTAVSIMRSALPKSTDTVVTRYEFQHAHAVVSYSKSTGVPLMNSWVTPLKDN